MTFSTGYLLLACIGFFSASCYGTPPTRPGSCRTVRVRKNVNSLSWSDKRRLDKALRQAERSGKWVEVGNYHGEPAMCGNRDRHCCDHEAGVGGNGFLAWHRLYLVQMEEVLGEALPYWDWTELDKVPATDFWRSGIMHRTIGGGRRTRREGNINSDYERLRGQVDTALRKKDFDGFSSQVAIPHGAVHTGVVGGDMAPTDTAGYDPIFYLHHAFVDYLFAFWQELQKERNRPDPVSQKVHEPFNRNSNTNQATRRKSRGITLDYERDLCYKYDKLLVRGRAPKKANGTNGLRYKGMTPKEALSYLDALDAQEREAIVVQPSSNPVSSRQNFEVCRSGKCFPAGSLDKFGVSPKSSRRSWKDYSGGSGGMDDQHSVELDITKVLRDLGWDPADRSITVRTASFVDVDGNELPLAETNQPMIKYHAANSPTETLRIPRRNPSSQDYLDWSGRKKNIKFTLDKPVTVEFIDEDGSFQVADMVGPHEDKEIDAGGMRIKVAVV